jgi:glycosyltransferase involved in cell wall biosynthesis
MKKKPIISVVTAVYNGASTVKEAIESVVVGCPPEVEYIIVDAGSTDGTLEIIYCYKNKISKIISEPDEGIYDAWNKGLRQSNGDYVCFLGADDVFIEGALSVFLKYVGLNPNVDYVSALCEYTDRPGSPMGRPFVWREFSRNMKVAHVGSLHSRRLFMKFGKFDSRYKIAGDYEFLLRCGSSISTGFINQVTTRCGSGGVSRSKGIETMREARQAKIQHCVCPLILSYTDYYFAVLKYMIKRLLRLKNFRKKVLVY